MPSRRTAWIVLSPSGVEAAVAHRGTIQTYARSLTDPSRWASSWEDGLRPLDAALREAASGAKITPRDRCLVAYKSPSLVCELVTVPAAGRDAADAARLAFVESLGAGPGARLSAVHVLAGTRPRDQRSTDVLVVADDDSAASDVQAWVVRAGLKLDALVPTPAVQLARAVRGILDVRTPGPVGIVDLGEHRTAIAVADGGELRCARSMRFGYASVVDSICAGLRQVIGERAGDRQRVVDMLFTSGLPERDAQVGEFGLSGTEILPLVQPALQRIAVELKQTLRFALGDAAHTRAAIVVIGSGSRVRGMAASLGAMIETDISSAEPGPAPGVSATSDLPAYLAAFDRRMTYVPLAEGARRSARRFSQALTAGGLIAGLTLAADAGHAWRGAAEFRAQLRAIEPQVAEVRDRNQQRGRATDLSLRLAEIEAGMNHAVGPRVSTAWILKQITAAMDDRVRLTGVELGGGVSGQSATVQGLVFNTPDGAGGAGAPTDAIVPLLAGLRDCGAFDLAEVASARSGAIGDQSVTYFTLSLRARSVPVSLTRGEP